jgi:hypothetical protein
MNFSEFFSKGIPLKTRNRFLIAPHGGQGIATQATKYAGATVP